MDDEPTVCVPSNVYILLKKQPVICALMGIHTLQDADNFVKRMYKKESWPERLKESQEESREESE